MQLKVGPLMLMTQNIGQPCPCHACNMYDQLSQRHNKVVAVGCAGNVWFGWPGSMSCRLHPNHHTV